MRQLSALPSSSRVPTFLLEQVLLVLPQIVAQTFTDFTPVVLLALIVTGAVCRAMTQHWHDPQLKSKWHHDKAQQLFTHAGRNYLTNYRAGVMLTSAVAILAVDFTVFPRRFAKTETYGTGLMDLGVGCFIFSSGLASRHARSQHPAFGAGRVPRGRVHEKRPGLWACLRPVLVQCLPLLVLGSGRLLVHRGVKYQEHVSEYGVHWNFFLTLVAVYVLGCLLHWALPPKALLPFSLVMLVSYQIHLSLGNLSHYIIHAPRDPASFVSQNREGIYGVVGYLCLYLLAEQVGIFFLWRPSSTKAKHAEALARQVSAEAARRL
jgi:glucosaminylphosphatidylinositol acyltransferase